METISSIASLNSCKAFKCKVKTCETGPLITAECSPSKEVLECVVERELGSASGTQCLSPLPTTGLQNHRLNTVTSLYPPLAQNLACDSDSQLGVCTLNSYKYNKPRIYVQNTFPDTDKKQVHMLRDTAILLGTKNRPAYYNEYLNALLSMSKKLSPKGTLKRS